MTFNRLFAIVKPTSLFLFLPFDVSSCVVATARNSVLIPEKEIRGLV
jgi:hypothetical protein